MTKHRDAGEIELGQKIALHLLGRINLNTEQINEVARVLIPLLSNPVRLPERKELCNEKGKSDSWAHGYNKYHDDLLKLNPHLCQSALEGG